MVLNNGVSLYNNEDHVCPMAKQLVHYVLYSFPNEWPHGSPSLFKLCYPRDWHLISYSIGPHHSTNFIIA